MRAIIAQLSQSSFMHVVGAFVAMGGWAFFANSAYEMPKPLFAALLQGGLSACITLFLKKTIEALAARLSGIIALIAPPLAAIAASFILLTTLHTLAGTPEVFLTIALPFTVASLYAAIYNFSLWKTKGAINDER